MVETLTGRVPTGLDAVGTEKVVKAAWYFFADYIAPDIAKGASKLVSAPIGPGKTSVELDLVIMLEKKGAGLSVTVRYGSLTELFESIFGR